MKNMTLGAFAFACAVALASTPGHALSFNFSFTNDIGNTPGTVTGEIDGLQDNASGPATAIFINSAPSVFNLTTPFSVPFLPEAPNSFTVNSGNIDASFFTSFFTINIISDYSLLLQNRPNGPAVSELACFCQGLPNPEFIVEGQITYSRCPAPSPVQDCPA
jgi:hypothetical protein